MKFFRKRHNRTVGKGTDKIVDMGKIFDVLNYTPLDYSYTAKYAYFVSNSEKLFRDFLRRTNADPYNSDSFDAEIEAAVEEMRKSAREQYIYHLQVINSHKGLVEGEFVKARGYREHLVKDREAIDSEIEKYSDLKEELNVH